MKVWDWISGLIADIVSSLAGALIVAVIAIVLSLLAGWIDLGTVLGWLRGLAP